MLILIVPSSIFILGTILVILGWVKYDSGVMIGTGSLITGVALIVLLVLGACLAGTMNTFVQTEEFVDSKVEYNYITDNISRIGESVDFDKDILTRAVEYNRRVSLSKKYKDNIWIGKFYNPLLADLKFIDISKLIGE